MGKQTNTNYKVKKQDIDYTIVNKLVFIIYAILITIPLLFRGGYFEKELLPILIVVNIVFVVWLFIQRNNYEFKIFNNPIEILFFGIVIMYLLSIVYGVSKRGSIIEFTKYFSYFAIIILGINLSKDKKLEKGILDGIIIGSIIVSVIGIGTAIGTWEYPGAVVSGRISSTFQYPNTLAAYVGAIFFLTLTMLINEKSRVKKGLYGIVLGTLIFTFILTYSRAMWVMFPVSVLLYFIFITNSRKLETLIYMIGSVIISVPASFLFTRGVSEPNNKLWVIFIIASLGTGLLTYMVSFLDNKFRTVSIKKLLIVLTILFILVIALGVYVVNSTTEITLNNESTDNKWTTLNRNITNVQPSTDYILKLTYTGKSSSEAAYLGRVLVYNIGDNDETTQLSLVNIIESAENTFEIPFRTDDNSVGVRVSFQNYYSGTSITVKESTIIEVDNNKSLVKIPLKYKYIPESIVSRFNSITAGDTSFTRRITFNKDGLEIIKDYPILGTGGEGWRTLYQSYQSEPYISNLAHNFFLQLWIEIGLIGLILIVGILLLLTVASFKTFKQSKDDSIKALLVGLYITIFTMLFHAVVDFDMSLSGYAIVVWVIVGVLVSNLNFANLKLDKVIGKIGRVNTKVYIYGISMITLIIIFNIGSIILGDIYAQKAIKANESNEVVSVMKNFEKATRFDSYEPSHKINLSSVYMQMYSTLDDVNYAKKAIEQVDDYIKVSPYGTQSNANASSFYLSIGEIDKGLEYLEKIVKLQPMRAESYTQKLDGYFAVFDYYFSMGENSKAKDALKEGLTVKEQISVVNENSEKPIEENIELVYKIGETQFFLENMDILGEISRRNLVLDFAYYFDVDINDDDKLDMLYISKPEGSNILYERAQEKDDYIKITNNGDKSGFIYPNRIKLEPNTNYLVEIVARGNTNPETFRAYAWSNGSAEPNQGGLDSISLTEDWETYSFEFTTDSDVQPGKQYIRLQHSGNDEGYIDIKDLVIFKVRD